MTIKIVLLFTTIAITYSGVAAKHLTRSVQNASDIPPDGYIAGGSPAAVGQFPWIARLSIRDRKEQTSYLCAGSLISEHHVLSAAHCFEHEIEHFNDVKIYLGEYDTETFPKDCANGRCTNNVLVYPNKIYRHANYDSTTIANDIALLRLQKRAPLSATIRPIPLPPFNIDHAGNDGASVLIAGWGRTQLGFTSNILLSTEINLILKPKCLELASDVPSGHLCAGDSNGKDTCPGDSGGPLMMYYNKKYYLAGIVSYGPNVECGRSPAGYYTNVFKYMKWIKNNM